MSIDAFSLAFGSTDWEQMRAAGQKRAAALSLPVSTQTPARPATPAQPAAKSPDKADKDADLLTFGDLLDTINPLQHIPLVDGLYRHLTGDTIRPQGQVLGGLLYGGLIGGAVATAGVIFHEITGIDPEEELISAILGDSPSTPTATVVAQAADGKPTTLGPPTQLHPPRPSSITAQAHHAPAPAPAITEAQTASNTNALQKLALDLAAGAQAEGISVAPASGSGSASPPASMPAAGTATQSRAGKMPVRGSINPNSEMPAGFYAPNHRYGGFAHAPVRTPGQPQAPAQTQALAQTQAQGITQAATPGAQTPPAPPSPEAISQMMIRNLEKYQAMSRRADRPTSQTNYIN